MPLPPTSRFSDRVADYVKARPGYPESLVPRLQAIGGLPRRGHVADIGCGTGISAALLLQFGYEVTGVEPNAPMREAAERALGHDARFHSVAGTAEATTLADRSVDAIFAAQAFHWFDPPAARAEFRRILRSPQSGAGAGPVTLVWNDRRLDGSDLLVAYEALLQRFAIDYNQVNHRRIDDAAVDAFFDGGEVRSFTLENVQRLDRDGLRGRLRSSSYVPAPDHPQHAPMMAELDRIFDRCQRGGEVEVVYDVRVWVGWFGLPFSRSALVTAHKPD